MCNHLTSQLTCRTMEQAAATLGATPPGAWVTPSIQPKTLETHEGDCLAVKSATTLRNRLYCNPGAPFNVRDTESIPLIQAANHTANKEIFVKTEHLSRDVGSPHIKPPIVTMATLIGIATYLAVVGVVHVLSSPDATAAVARDISMSPALTAGASTFSVPPQSEGLPSRSTPNQ